MEKFLSIPVTSEQSQLLSAIGVVLVEQASTTTVAVTYQSGLVATITHATAGAGVETARDGIQDAISAALKTEWTKPVYAVPAAKIPFAVSGIALSFMVQPTA
tara:strand:- start:7464 stop:7772 length:309 start_codon:yes stop_codon:yes gene_type:complete